MSPSAALPPAALPAAAGYWAGLRSPRAVVSFAAVLAALSGLFAWSPWTKPRGPEIDRFAAGPVSEIPGQSVPSPGTAPTEAVVAAPQDGPAALRYFGVPIEGQIITYVVDQDQAMAPYIEQLAMVTNAVNKSIQEAGNRRIGIVPPPARRRSQILEVAERKSVLEGADAVLAPRLSAHRTDPAEELAQSANWFADQVFLVLAHRLDPREIEILTQASEQTGAVTHVVAVGSAAQQDLSPIAAATGGRFVVVDDSTLATEARLAGERLQQRLATATP